MKKIIIPVIILAVAAAAVSVYFLLKSTPGKQEYQYVKISKGDIRNVITCTGSLQFTFTVNIPALTSGVVKSVSADYNLKVKQGDVLAQLDDTLLNLSLESAKTALDKAVFQYNKADKDLNDTRKLYEKNFRSKSDLDTAEDTFETAKAAMTTARVNYETAKINLEYTKITAPVSGIIIERNIDVGDSVSTGTGTVFVIASDISQMQALANVDENDISSVKPGQLVDFTVQAYQDKKFGGKVTQIRLNPTTVQNVVNYTVVIDVLNKDGFLLPGMTATLEIVVEQKLGVLRVPSAALKFIPTEDMFRQTFANGDHGGSNTSRGQWQGQGGTGQNTGRGQWQGNGSGGNQKDRALLWVLDETTKQVKPMPVKLGATDGQWTEVITDNLADGAQIVSGFTSSKKTQSRSTGTNPFQQQRGGGPGPF